MDRTARLDSTSEKPSAIPPRMAASRYLNAYAMPHEARDIPHESILSSVHITSPMLRNIVSICSDMTGTSLSEAMNVVLFRRDIAVLGIILYIGVSGILPNIPYRSSKTTPATTEAMTVLP